MEILTQPVIQSTPQVVEPVAVAPVIPPTVAPVIEPSKVPDLITRVSQFKPEPIKEDDSKFNINDLDSQIEKVSDPVLKEQMVGLKKSLLRGENQKYQEIASLRKQYEQQIAGLSTWTPERVNGLLKDPNFVNAAQSILTTQQTTDTSMLSEAERNMLNENNRQVQSLMYQNQQLLRVQQDAQLKNKYADYDSTVVDRITDDLLNNKIQATREDLWKVAMHDEHVKRAYELGKQDRITENNEKVNGMTFQVGQNLTPINTIQREKGETVQAFMLRSYQEHSKKK